jgi:hypothetical protein
VFARRAIARALSEPAPASLRSCVSEIEALRALAPPPLADPATRAALWRDAGIVRCGRGLGRLLGHPHPLARLIARCALARAESRGAHQRLDHPGRDPALDYRHALVSGDGDIAWHTWT